MATDLQEYRDKLRGMRPREKDQLNLGLDRDFLLQAVEWGLAQTPPYRKRTDLFRDLIAYGLEASKTGIELSPTRGAEGSFEDRVKLAVLRNLDPVIKAIVKIAQSHMRSVMDSAFKAEAEPEEEPEG